ncbi:MAG: hypothetical protein E4H40_03665 [Candidatus Brocadiia bacterium]|nr:MAG: hypothetical protein E4H40_03665 [Candidatus Brocadiia bacterium]
MKITTIDFFPLRLAIGAPGSPLGTDSNAMEQRDATAEVLAAQRYTPPETVFVRIRTDSGIQGFGDGATLPHYFDGLVDQPLLRILFIDDKNHGVIDSLPFRRNSVAPFFIRRRPTHP